MTPDQLKELRDIKQKLDDIRGNEEVVKELKSRVQNLIKEEADRVNDKIKALAEV